MDYGKVENPEEVDLHLPQDHEETKKLLKSTGDSGKCKIYAGGAKWGRKEWIGKIYPEKASEKDFLKYYAENFNSIELNSTYYQVPSEITIKKWKSTAGEDFIFCPKFPKEISHIKWLKDAEKATDQFFKKILLLEENLGPCFLQLPPNFSINQKEQLFSFLKILPKGNDIFVEFRSPSWFKQSEETAELFEFLKDHHIGAVITDSPGRRDAIHMRLTTPSAFIRFVGSDLHPTDFIRIDEWVKRLMAWIKQGLQELYFFVHQPDEAFTPELMAYTVQEFNKHLKAKLPELVLVNLEL